MKTLLVKLTLILLSTTLFAQNFTIELIVHSVTVNDNEDIFVTGNNPQFGNWQPNIVQLEKTDATHWSKQFNFQNNEILEFKFTKGSWQTEALDNNGKVPQNHVIKVSKDTTIEVWVNKWKDSLIADNATFGQVTGTLEYIRNLEGNGILPRDIVIWLPPSYKKNSKKRFPVLYMHDGQNLFDPKTSSFGIDWQVDETADSLINQGEIEEIIIVGIYNTSDRTFDYSPGKKGTNYMKFIIEKLKPMIDKKYRTLSDRENTAVAGSSMGGLISFMLAWEYDNIFSKAACFSPAFLYNSFNYIDIVKETCDKRRDVIFYIDNGGIGLEEQLQPGVDLMLETLYDLDYEINVDFFYIKDPEARHFESAWAERMHIPLEIFFGK